MGGVVSEAIAEAFRAGPGMLRARVEKALRELGYDGWACSHVSRLVAEGELPEQDVYQALEEFREELAKEQAGQRTEPIRNRRAYLSKILSRQLARHGLPWRKRA